MSDREDIKNNVFLDSLMHNPKWKKKLGSVFLWVLIILAIWLLWEPFTILLEISGEREEIIRYVRSFGLLGPVILITFIFLQMIVAAVPGHLLMFAAGYLYGFWRGFFLSWIVTVVGGQFTFYLARRYGKPLVEKLVSTKVLEKWYKIAKHQGVVFFTFSLVVPIFPADVMCYIAGFATISGRRFFVANLIGHAPVALLLCLAGAYGFELSTEAIIAIIIISIIMFAGWLMYGKYTSTPSSST